MEMTLATKRTWREAARKVKRTPVDIRDAMLCAIFNASSPTLWAEGEERVAVALAIACARVARKEGL